MQIINRLKSLFHREDPGVALVVGIVGAFLKAAEKEAANHPPRLVPEGHGFPCNISFRVANDVYQGEKTLLHGGEVINISAFRSPGGPYDAQRANGETILLERDTLELSGSIKPHSKTWGKIHRCAKRMANTYQCVPGQVHSHQQ